MIEPAHPKLSVTQQCALLGLPRSSFYYQPEPMPEEDARMMRGIDELYLAYPFYGSRQMTRALRREGHTINRKRVQRLMRLMGLEAIYQKPNLSRPNAAHKIYPYLLRKLAVTRPNQVWATDITYVPIRGGCIYLCAVIDWFSRRVLAWELSNTLDATFCVRAVQRAITEHGVPEIFNTDHVFVERLWRSVKYEEIHLRGYVSGVDAYAHLERYFNFYNHRRPHSSLEDRTPDEAYCEPLSAAVNQ